MECQKRVGSGLWVREAAFGVFEQEPGSGEERAATANDVETSSGRSNTPRAKRSLKFLSTTNELALRGRDGFLRRPCVWGCATCFASRPKPLPSALTNHTLDRWSLAPNSSRLHLALLRTAAWAHCIIVSRAATFLNYRPAFYRRRHLSPTGKWTSASQDRPTGAAEAPGHSSFLSPSRRCTT
ncbi:hypothetical protein VTI74DRAFT_10815 [Chaetomium olivicolor]